MSSGMRRVRRDARQTLPTVSTSKSAPRLFSSASKRGNGNLGTQVNNSFSSDYSANDKEKKPLARNMAPIRGDEKDVTIEVVEDFNHSQHAKEIMSANSSSFNPNSRNSISELRKQHKIGLIAKGLGAFALMTFVATQVFGSGSEIDDVAYRKSMSNIVAQDHDADYNPMFHELDKKAIKARGYKKENDDIFNVPMGNSKTKPIDSKQDVFVLKEGGVTKTMSNEKKLNTKDESEDEPSLDFNADTNLKYVRSNKSKKNRENRDKSPKLSGGVTNSFTVKALPDIPDALGNFADFSSKVDMENDVPFFWDIHLGGGTVVEHIFGKCHNLLQASEMGIQHDINDAGFDESLQVLNINGEHYLNVDTTSESGLQHAKDLNMLNSDLSPDVIYSPLVHELGSIFTPSKRGRMFAVFRHPIERAVGMYFYLQTATWDPMYNPKLSKMSIDEYALSESVENNWMTRFLLNKKGGKLTPNDLEVAKEIVRRKCLVGLFEKMEESILRFEIYFGWREGLTSKQKKCGKKLLSKGDQRHEHPMVEEGTKAWKALVQHNKYDMELYEYAQKLFKEQGGMKKSTTKLD